ncbi:MAG: hypothetical protein DMG42_33770, partial [Acidobacteria bacterium]
SAAPRKVRRPSNWLSRDLLLVVLMPSSVFRFTSVGLKTELNRSPSTAGPADWYARWVRLNNKRLVL